MYGTLRASLSSPFSGIMRPLMPLCLSMLCLLLPTASVTMAGFNTSATNVSIASKAPTHTAVVSTNATEGLSSSALHTSTASVTAQRENNSTSTKATIATHQSTETIKPQNSKQSSLGTVVVIVFILMLIILLVFAFRWYMLNPARRSFRGLWYSIVETARLAWSTIRGCLQRPQKRAEEIEADEEVEEMEAGGGGGENMEEGPKEEGAKQEDNDSDSDSSLEEYSIVDAANLAEGEKQTGGEEEDRKSAKEEGGETEEMTSVTLEDDEKAEPEEVDDLTPL
ncbi:uncharacterized protein LOC108413153 isoform X1 [Pygocentrus nattereri]|uniref:uncharacterized protein LOC108413153 isoform X1 n=2 Tax=Pygocentrus nattereri TaxID=42514 RepID=UPI000814ABAA|nr:uncharacterized protein LOC108413153 isoform X1 [Pygocentrus nattereri]XP_037388608.1 uncharacterized protein LOC108413153 isoform X1 [Pygocentrus nattereri]